jgi:hypothetical protein
MITASIINALMMEAVSASDTSVDFCEATQRNILEYRRHYTRRRKSHLGTTIVLVFTQSYPK